MDAIDLRRLSSDPLPAGVFASPDSCPMCGHDLTTNAHDEDDGTGCESCNDAADLGTYAPCQSYNDGAVLIAGVLYDADTLEEV